MYENERWGMFGGWFYIDRVVGVIGKMCSLFYNFLIKM